MAAVTLLLKSLCTSDLQPVFPGRLRCDPLRAEVAVHDHVPTARGSHLEGAVERITPQLAPGDRHHVRVRHDAVVGAELVDDGAVADVPRADRDRGSGDRVYVIVPRSEPSGATAVTMRHGVPVSDALRYDRPSHVPAYFCAGPAAADPRDISPGAHPATTMAAQSNVRMSYLRYALRSGV